MILLSGTIHNVKVWTIILAGAHHQYHSPSTIPISLSTDQDILPKPPTHPWSMKKVRSPRKVREPPGPPFRPVCLPAEMRRKIEHWGNILLIVPHSVSLAQWQPSSNDIRREDCAQNYHFSSSLWNLENIVSVLSQSQSMKMIINDSQNPNPWIWK